MRILRISVVLILRNGKETGMDFHAFSKLDCLLALFENTIASMNVVMYAMMIMMM